MSLPIIIDKSTFQSLNFEEIILLHNYYRPNITPILTMEILGDLKKEFDNSTKSSGRVEDFAKKLLPYNSAVNMFYRELFVADLISGDTPLDYTPVLGSSELVKSTSGKIGFHFRESPQEKAISRWREGNFLEAEKELAQIWRETTTKKDLLENLKESLKTKIKIEEKFKNLDDLNEYLIQFMQEKGQQENILTFLLSEFSVSAESASKIFYRWSRTDNKSIKEFAPFAFHCGKVKIFFDFALRFNLVGTRPTNMLDLQYFYYLPFAKLFTSNDKFQKSLAPYLIDTNQDFIDGAELKKDLKNLVEYRKTLFEKKDIERTKDEPPRLPESLTYKLWSKYFDWPPKYKSRTPLRPEECFKEKMDEFIAAKKTVATSTKDTLKNVEFIVREHNMKPTDLCFCGSGKMFKDCHLPKDYKENSEKYGW